MILMILLFNSHNKKI